MAELKTIVMGLVGSVLAAGDSVRFSDELIAEKNMKIVGAVFHYTNNLGQDTKAAVTRSGVYCEPGSYVSGEIMDTDNGVLFADRISNPENTVFAELFSRVHMLPDGHFFTLEKGERIYAHVEHHNKHGTTGYTFTTNIVIYYY